MELGETPGAAPAELHDLPTAAGLVAALLRQRVPLPTKGPCWPLRWQGHAAPRRGGPAWGRHLVPVQRLVPMQGNLLGVLRELILVLPVPLLAGGDADWQGWVAVPRREDHGDLIAVNGAELCFAQNPRALFWRGLQVNAKLLDEALVPGTGGLRARVGITQARFPRGNGWFGLPAHLPLEALLRSLARSTVRPNPFLEDLVHADTVIVGAARGALARHGAGRPARRGLRHVGNRALVGGVEHVPLKGMADLARGAHAEGLADRAAAVPVTLRGCGCREGGVGVEQGSTAADALPPAIAAVCEGRAHGPWCGGRCAGSGRGGCHGARAAVQHLGKTLVKLVPLGVLLAGAHEGLWIHAIARPLLRIQTWTDTELGAWHRSPGAAVGVFPRARVCSAHL
mmetsp:Transcript_42855/g.136178  ORF Transcript_42855/g.136178 Transcript_42855/m.136178 type:complete len:398 (+) Transcript_42855:323-1516(+)